jgi:hypothetical protein
MREQVLQLIQLGALPASSTAEVDHLTNYDAALQRIPRPLSDEEACALVALFGPDDCFGMAWTLLHLIETAPSWPIDNCIKRATGPWAQHLRDTAARSNNR